ncbi:MAG: ATP-dependent Clp protease ATP-binding subunit ClpA [Desulfuromonadales bacterium]|nr:ATP-dependent Clp protease ATP-binding subunit ClpA [Desulfuromonadales bacterium]
MFAQEVQITFSLAVREAQRRRHEYLTTEHILYAMLLEEHGKDLIAACGGDIEALKGQLEKYFSEHLESIVEDPDAVPEQTIGLQRVLQRAVLHLHSAGKKEITIGDLLAAMFAEKNAYAVHFLEEQGVSRLDVLNFISHGVTRVSRPNGASQAQTSAQPGGGSQQKTNEGGGNRIRIRWRCLPSISWAKPVRDVSIPLSDAMQSLSARYRCCVGGVKTIPFLSVKRASARPPWPKGWH